MSMKTANQQEETVVGLFVKAKDGSTGVRSLRDLPPDLRDAIQRFNARPIDELLQPQE
jgi:hypothetical protein